MIRKAKGIWKGSLKEGAGTLSTDSGVLKGTAYSFRSRFEDGKETNPEELISAAHAGCFSMALSLILGEAGIVAESIETEAALTMEPVDGAPTVKSIHLTSTISAPGASADVIKQCAASAKQNCPISRVLKAEITLEVIAKV